MNQLIYLLITITNYIILFIPFTLLLPIKLSIINAFMNTPIHPDEDIILFINSHRPKPPRHPPLSYTRYPDEAVFTNPLSNTSPYSKQSFHPLHKIIPTVNSDLIRKSKIRPNGLQVQGEVSSRHSRWQGDLYRANLNICRASR